MYESKQACKQWMKENAEWYSQHYEYPVGEIAEEAMCKHDRPQYSDDYCDFILEQFYKVALCIFKQQKLSIHKDGED